MPPNGRLCPSCGHLSPAERPECHNCTATLDGESLSVTELRPRLTGEYPELPRYVLTGYLLAVGGFAAALAATVAGWGPVTESPLGQIGLLGALVGLSVAVGDVIHTEIAAGDYGSPPGVVITFLTGLIACALGGLTLGFLLSVPVVQYLVGGAIGLTALASPWLVYRYRRRHEGVEPVGPLAAYAVATRDEAARDLALAVAAEGGDEAAHKATSLFVEQLGTDPETTRFIAKSDQFVACARALCVKDGEPSPTEVVDTLVADGSALESRDNEAGEVCLRAATELSSAFDIEQQRVDQETDRGSPDGHSDSETAPEGDTDDRPSTEEAPDDGGSDTPAEPDEAAKTSEDRSRRRMRAELQRLDSRTDKPFPSGDVVSRDGEYSLSQYIAEFGSHELALEAAGINVQLRLRDEIRRVRDQISEVPTKSEFRCHGQVSVQTIERYLGSWEEAIASVAPVVPDSPLRDELLTELRQAADSSDPETERLSDRVDYSVDEYTDEFGSWRAALDAAGIDVESRLLDELRRVDEKAAVLPDRPRVERQSPFNTDDYTEMFGSWEAALEAAGIDAESRLLEEIRRVSDEIDRIPSRSEMDRLGRVSPDTVVEQFGSWSDATLLINPSPDETGGAPATESAVDATATFTDDSSDSELAADTHVDAETGNDDGPAEEPSRKELIAEIRRLDDGTRLYPYGNKVGERGWYGLNEFIDEFGSWEETLEAAGIDIEARLLGEIRRVQSEIGAPPTQQQMDSHGRVSASTCARYLGSWSEAKSRAAATETDGEDREPSPDSNLDERDGPTADETTTGVPEGLATAADVPSDGEVGAPLLIQIDAELDAESHLAAAFRVTDAAGESLRFDVHEQHSLGVDWQTEEWYLIDGARGRRGWGAEQRLTTGSGLRVKPLGSVRPDLDALVGGSDADEWQSTTDETGESNGTDETQHDGGEGDSAVGKESAAVDNTDDESPTGDDELDTLMDELDDMV